jgi:ribose transport system ATP-binding protein
VGLVGLPDAGCRDLLEGLYGSQTARTGTVSIDGRPLPRLSPRASLGRRLALLTDDRMATGLLPDRPLRENISVAALALQPRQGRALRAHEDALTAMGIAQCDIRPADPGRPMAFFSGGNQQKALIARWIATDASVFLLNEPTRGVDAGARADIYRLLRSLAAAGASVLVHSSDIRELLGLTDRLLVMHRGQIIAEHASDAVSEPQLLAEASLGTGAQP